MIGGIVYRGSRLPELVGAYVFADYVSGNIWALRWDGSTVTSFQRLASHTGIAGFGVNPSDGEVLLIDHDGGKLLELDYAISSGAELPATLTDVGAFAELGSLTPEAGIVPYDVNVPFWSDGAQKRRWFSVPDVTRAIGFSSPQNWSFPAGTVWIKHFELTNAVGGPRRLETRVLVKTTNDIYGVTYRWGTSTNVANLVTAQGLDEPILVSDGGGVIRTQLWHYPSRSEYLTGGNPFNTADPWKVQIQRAAQAVQLSVSQSANRAIEVQFTTNAFPSVWQPLDVPSNRPFFPATNRVAVVQDVATNEPARLYRVTVREP